MRIVPCTSGAENSAKLFDSPVQTHSIFPKCDSLPLGWKITCPVANTLPVAAEMLRHNWVANSQCNKQALFGWYLAQEVIPHTFETLISMH